MLKSPGKYSAAEPLKVSRLQQYSKILLAAIAVIASAGILYGYYLHQGKQQEEARNKLAVGCVGDMLSKYLSKNDDRWPTGWQDLEPIYNKRYKNRYGGPTFFAEMQERVAIDWSADIRQLYSEVNANHRGPPFRVVWLTDGSSSEWRGTEPNRLIYEHFRQEADSH